MKEVKKLSELSKTNQNLLTCKEKEKTYIVEVTNNTTNNVIVEIGVINTPFYIGKEKGVISFESLTIKPNETYRFKNVVCREKEKIFIHSTTKDVSVIIHEN